MELEDPMWPTRALLNEDEERAASLGDALLREPDVDVSAAATAPLLIIAASPAAAALVGHCLCGGGGGSGPSAEAAGRVSLPTLPTPRVPTGEGGAAGGGRRKPSGAQDDDDGDDGAAAAAAAAASAAADADRDQDASALPVPEYCRGSECPIFAFEGALVVVAAAAPAGSAAAAALGGGGNSNSSSIGGSRPVPDARAGAWARGVLTKMRPSRVIVVAETPGEQYRGEGDPSEELLAFTVWTSAAAAAAASSGGKGSGGKGAGVVVPPTLPAGTVVGGLPAALLAECEFMGVPAVAVVAVEMAAAMAATHAPALGRAVAAVVRSGGGGGGSSAAEAAVAARLESAPLLHAARHDMERALPAGGVYT
jgi:hypothetical protein